MSKAQQNTVDLPLTLRLIEAGLVMVCSIFAKLKASLWSLTWLIKRSFPGTEQCLWLWIPAAKDSYSSSALLLWFLPCCIRFLWEFFVLFLVLGRMVVKMWSLGLQQYNSAPWIISFGLNKGCLKGHVKYRVSEEIRDKCSIS